MPNDVGTERPIGSFAAGWLGIAAGRVQGVALQPQGEFILGSSMDGGIANDGNGGGSDPP